MDYEYVLGPDGELYHWGIKGMKWGQRRYQNQDGSLTPAGRKRYSAEMAALKEREKSIKSRERAKAQQDKLDAKKAELDAREKALEPQPKSKKFGKSAKNNQTQDQPKHKSAKDMTDEELSKAIERARKEDEYNRLRPEPAPKRSIMNRLIDDVAMPALTEYGKKALGDMMTNAAKNAIEKNTKVDPNSVEALRKTAEKLELKNRIRIAKEGKSDRDLTWDERLKKQQYDDNVKKREDGRRGGG